MQQRGGVLWLFIASVAILSCLVLLSYTEAANDLQEALRLYFQVIRGEKKIDQLPPAELQQFLLIYRLMSSRSSSESEECREARETAISAADDLEYSARRLANCASNRDLTDDCESEFVRVKNAHEDYESAVSEVNSECD